MVSEVMLQQTQVERVLTKYAAFLDRSPTYGSGGSPACRGAGPLAGARLQPPGHDAAAGCRRDTWRGMAGSCRILFRSRPSPRHRPLHSRCYCRLCLRPATSFIETNIRRVFIHLFFHDRTDVSDREILPLVEQTLDRSNIRDWYNALMDYGAMLKKTTPNPSRRSRGHSRQSPFRGSNREIRGEILRLLLETPGLSAGEIVGHSDKDGERLRAMLGALVSEGCCRSVRVGIG